jgi:predicted Fe-Mo cluster-binding NifX family protein
MIAIPVKTDKDNPAVSTLFGKSKWFAFVNGDSISIEANSANGGRAVVESMIQKGVTKVIFNHMGANPFMLLQKSGIECFYDGGDRILLDDVLTKLSQDELIKVDNTNMSNYIESGKAHNSGDKHHHH